MGRHLLLLAALDESRRASIGEREGQGEDDLPLEVRESLEAIKAENEFHQWVHTLNARSISHSFTAGMTMTTTTTITTEQGKEQARELRREQERERTTGWEPEDLPPTLGGVRVWHAFVLNPRCEWGGAVFFSFVSSSLSLGLSSSLDWIGLGMRMWIVRR
jgi:hypothetical protein